MNNVRTIYLDWYNGSVRATGGSQLAYQYDHLSNLVIFENAPKLDNYYLIVEMKETEDGEVRTFEPIQLAGSFWLIPNSYTQLAQNISFQVCCKTENGDFERHSAQFTGTILPSKDHSGAELDVDPSIMYDPYKQWVSDIAMAAGAIIIDPTLSIQGVAADAKAVGDAVDGLDERLTELEQGGTGGLTEEAKQALLNLVSHIGLWDDDHGQDYIDALEAALYPPASLTRITAVYTQSGVVYEGSELNNLKADLVVTAVYSDSTSEVITAYTLTGTLEEGTSTITVSYGGKTTTFDVTVTGQLLPSGYQQLEYVYSDGGGVYFESLVKPTAYPIRIETGIYKASQANSEQAIITKKYGSSASLEVGYNATANTLFAYSGASAKITDPAMYGNVLDVVAEFKTASPYKTLDVTADEETLTAENTTANHTSILANSPLLFFGLGTTVSNYIGRMYYCKVYSGGELIGDFIPCYDKETGCAGLYETVGGTFHHSQGPNGFKRGGEV